MKPDLVPGKVQRMNPNEDPKVVYKDIIHHPHHQSLTRAHMSLYDRAAQFSAFDALAGYSDMITEEARLTDSEIVLDENAIELLNQKLSLIADVIEDGHLPTITFTVFVPDQHKEGGRYEDRTETVKKIDAIERKIILKRKNESSGINQTIEIAKVVAIHGELVDYMDERTD